MGLLYLQWFWCTSQPTWTRSSHKHQVYKTPCTSRIYVQQKYAKHFLIKRVSCTFSDTCNLQLVHCFGLLPSSSFTLRNKQHLKVFPAARCTGKNPKACSRSCQRSLAPRVELNTDSLSGEMLRAGAHTHTYINTSIHICIHACIAVGYFHIHLRLHAKSVAYDEAGWLITMQLHRSKESRAKVDPTSCRILVTAVHRCS